MERIEDKKRRFAEETGMTRVRKGCRPQPIKRSDGTYSMERNIVRSPYVGDKALGKVIRSNGTEDIVALRWSEDMKCYNVIKDDNVSMGTIIEFELIYGSDNNTGGGAKEQGTEQ